MWRAYLVVALRQLWRNKAVSAINVAGLSAALAVCALALLFVRKETGYDSWHANADRIYAVYGVRDDPRGGAGVMFLDPALDEVLRNGIRGVARTVRMRLGDARVAVGGHDFSEYMLAVEPAFLEVFDFPLAAGDATTCLRDPAGVVLTDETARKYFGDRPAVGERLALRVTRKDWSQRPPKETTVEEERIVTGVLAPPPGGSILRFRMLLPFEAGESLGFEQHSGTFLELSPNADPVAVRARLPEPAELGHQAYRRLDLRPLLGAHFGPRIYGPTSIGAGTVEHSMLLGGLAALVLAIACINFVNLSLGRAVTRTLEVGVRKAVGARPGQLRRQWLVETTVIAAVSVAGGLVAAQAMLPAFNEVVHQRLELDLASWETLGAAGAMALLVGGLSGLYPAVVTSRWPTVRALAGKSGAHGRARVGRGLIVAQFVLSTVLVLAAVTLERQLHYMQTKDLGFDGDQVYVASLQGAVDEVALARFVDEVASRGRLVKAVAAASPAPGLGSMGDARFLTGPDTIRARTFVVSPGFSQTLGLRLEAGRDLDAARPEDLTHGVLLNRSAARLFGDGPLVGETVMAGGPGGPTPELAAVDMPVTVVGIVEDFHFEAMHRRIGPAVLRLKPPGTQSWNRYWHLLFRLDRRDLPGGVQELAAMWERILPGREMQRPGFLSATFADRYEVEERVAIVLRWLTTVAVLIACMGLLGLALLAAARRTKEVGIRKVLGATAASIVGLMSRELALLVLLGNVIAWPVAWLGLERWLRMYAYRIEPGVGWFAVTAAAMALVALLAVSGQTLRAARANPVDALRDE